MGSVTVATNGDITVDAFTGVFTGPLIDGDFAVARYRSDGTLDSSFWGGGFVVTDFGASGNDVPRAHWIEPDGKIVLAGVTESGADTDFALLRYLTPVLFADGFESGDTSMWSNTVP